MGLEEHRKHASTKAKKLKKALVDVSFTLIYPLPEHRIYLCNTASFSAWQFLYIQIWLYDVSDMTPT